MSKPLALIIQANEATLASVTKFAEGRGYSVHVSGSIAEARRILTIIPQDQQKLVFIDFTLSRGKDWDEFTDLLRTKMERHALVCYDAQNIQSLYGLLGHASQPPIEPSLPRTVTPTMIGDTPQFYEVVN